MENSRRVRGVGNFHSLRRCCAGRWERKPSSACCSTDLPSKLYLLDSSGRIIISITSCVGIRFKACFVERN